MLKKFDYFLTKYDSVVGIIEQIILSVEELVSSFNFFDESYGRSKNSIKSALQSQLNIRSKIQMKSFWNLFEKIWVFQRWKIWSRIQDRGRNWNNFKRSSSEDFNQLERRICKTNAHDEKDYRGNGKH